MCESIVNSQNFFKEFYKVIQSCFVQWRLSWKDSMNMELNIMFFFIHTTVTWKWSTKLTNLHFTSIFFTSTIHIGQEYIQQNRKRIKKNTKKKIAKVCLLRKGKAFIEKSLYGLDLSILCLNFFIASLIYTLNPNYKFKLAFSDWVRKECWGKLYFIFCVRKS